MLFQISQLSINDQSQLMIKIKLKTSVSNACDKLRDMAPFAQFKKREKHPWTHVTLLKPATLQKVTLLHAYFSRFLNFENDTKSRKASHINKMKILI